MDLQSSFHLESVLITLTYSVGAVPKFPNLELTKWKCLTGLIRGSKGKEERSKYTGSCSSTTHHQPLPPCWHDQRRKISKASSRTDVATFNNSHNSSWARILVVSVDRAYFIHSTSSNSLRQRRTFSNSSLLDTYQGAIDFHPMIRCPTSEIRGVLCHVYNHVHQIHLLFGKKSRCVEISTCRWCTGAQLSINVWSIIDQSNSKDG